MSSIMEPFSLDTSLPDKVIVNILARVPRIYYSILPLVSKRFQSLVPSPELYARRISLGCTEAFIYVLLYNGDTSGYRWYILRRNAIRSCLVPIHSLPCMSYNASFVAVGSKIYAMGIYTLAIECKSHTVQSLPSMPMPMDCTVAGVIDGKIYVIGFSKDDKTKKVLEVFDTKTQTWEPEVIKLDMELKGNVLDGCTAVMDDKIYIRDYQNSFSYNPKERKWEKEEMLNSKWWEHACVVDDILYYFDRFKNKLRAYDSKHKCWGVVKGLEVWPLGISSWWSYTVSYGGKLVVLLSIGKENWSKAKHIWIMEIEIERRSGGEFWGKIEWCDVVYGGDMILVHPLAIMV